MRFGFQFIFITIFFLFVLSAVQNSAAQEPTCFEPFSQKFDEFTFKTPEDAKNHLTEFENKLQEKSAESKGYIFVYGGKKTRINEVTDMISEVRKILNVTDTSYNAKFQISDHGFRLLPTIELFISPLNCSKYPESTADFTVEQVEFAESNAQNTYQKTSDELAASIIKKTEIICPPAPRAVHVCGNSVEVFIIIDETGNAIFSKAVTGHPLLRAAAADVVKNWKFQPTKIKDKFYKSVGRIIVEFKQSD